MFSLQSKHAFITGGTAGIGLAVAGSYVEAGARVTISGRRDGEGAARDIGADFVRLDVRDEQAFRAALEQVADDGGKLDILVLNAGVVHEHSLAKLSSDEARTVLDVNVNGVFYGLKHGPEMMNDGGSIIITSSIAAFVASPESSVYSASKAGASQLMRCAAIELGPRGIRVNAVCPGGIKTEMALPEEVFQTLAPLGRIGETGDLMGIYNLLASDAAGYITGQELVVDGGLSAGVSGQVFQKIFE